MTNLLNVEATGDGVAWSATPDGVNVNLVVLTRGGSISEHRNADVDVLVVVLDGAIDVVVDGSREVMASGGAMLIPRSSRRTITTDLGARYLTIHRQRSMNVLTSR